MNIKNATIAVIGQGYVGLPLAVEFAKTRRVIGFDINKTRISELRDGIDSTLEVETELLKEASQLSFSSNVEDLIKASVYIVTVPTPIDKHKKPDLTPLLKASEMLGRVISKGDIVIYESTVYPGATEDDCIPVLEKYSGLQYNKDFYAGYSPERINPGDKEHRVVNILKVTSGSTPEVAELVDQLYKEIIVAGTHKASSIKVAEASKVIENTQRDVNIALINELAIIFNKMDIDTMDVLEAAGTKWNFMPFRPGLVGGHCIGVDPYYLTHKAEAIGYYPDMILASRRVNDGMAKYVVSELVKCMINKSITIKNSKVLLLGLAFKENCPDIRNTKVVDIVSELNEYNIDVDIVDPWCSAQQVKDEYDLRLIKIIKQNEYDSIILAVGHNEFKELGIDVIRSYGKEINVIYDLKCIFNAELVDIRL